MIKYNYEKLSSISGLAMRDHKPTRKKLATAPTEDASSVFKREIQNLALLIRQLKKTQQKMVDQPDNGVKTSNIAIALNSGVYVSKEIEMGVKIRDLENKLDKAKKRYQFLFEDDY